MPRARAELLPQIPHPGARKVIKWPTNAPGGREDNALLGVLDRAITYQCQAFIQFQPIHAAAQLSSRCSENILLEEHAKSHAEFCVPLG